MLVGNIRDCDIDRDINIEFMIGMFSDNFCNIDMRPLSSKCANPKFLKEREGLENIMNMSP